MWPLRNEQSQSEMKNAEDDTTICLSCEERFYVVTIPMLLSSVGVKLLETGLAILQFLGSLLLYHSTTDIPAGLASHVFRAWAGAGSIITKIVWQYQDE